MFKLHTAQPVLVQCTHKPQGHAAGHRVAALTEPEALQLGLQLRHLAGTKAARSCSDPDSRIFTRLFACVGTRGSIGGRGVGTLSELILTVPRYQSLPTSGLQFTRRRFRSAAGK